jgi:putative DNA-invertase from lambdoid prophage Rac
MLLGYSRWSTKGQDDGGTREEQSRKIKSVAMARGVEAFDIAYFTDDAVSGAKPLAERPAGKEMLEHAKRGDIIVASKLDRLFRSARNALAMIDDLTDRGIGVIIADFGYEPIADSMVGKLVFTILSGVADFERMRINQRMGEGRTLKRERQGCIGNVPYGYRKVGKGKFSLLEPDPYEQDVLTRVQNAVAAFPSWNLHNGCHRDAGDIRLYVRRWLNNDPAMKDRTGKPFTKLVQIEVLIKAARARGLNPDPADAGQGEVAA